MQAGIALPAPIRLSDQRGAAPHPARGFTPPETPAPFPSDSMFQNGPRCQGFASPRTNRAPLTAPGRSEDLPYMRERALTESTLEAVYRLPLVGPEFFQTLFQTITHTRRVLCSACPSPLAFQAHLVLETVLDFSIILRLENAEEVQDRTSHNLQLVYISSTSSHAGVSLMNA